MKIAFNAMRISSVVFLVPEKTYSLIANGVKIKNSSSHVMRIVTYNDALFNMGKSLWGGGRFLDVLCVYQKYVWHKYW